LVFGAVGLISDAIEKRDAETSRLTLRPPEFRTVV
jgi:hypothetical protein